MIEIGAFEEITQIRMSREIGGKPVYWVAAYLVDGLLIDTGCSYTARELVWGYPEPTEVLPIPPVVRTDGHFMTENLNRSVLKMA